LAQEEEMRRKQAWDGYYAQQAAAAAAAAAQAAQPIQPRDGLVIRAGIRHSASQTWLYSDPNGKTIRADQPTQPAAWTIEFNGPTSGFLRALNNNYLSAKSLGPLATGVACDSGKKSAAECWSIFTNAEGKTTFLSMHHQYLTRTSAGKADVAKLASYNELWDVVPM